MTEHVPTPEDDALEDTIRQLFYNLEDAPRRQHRVQDDRASGLREGSEIGCLIFEEFSIRGYEIP